MKKKVIIISLSIFFTIAIIIGVVIFINSRDDSSDKSTIENNSSDDSFRDEDSDKKSLKKQINKDLQIFNNAEIDNINKMIFNESTNSYQTLSAEGEIDSDNDGIMENIIGRSNVELYDLLEDTIIFKIKSPDLSNIFQDLSENTDFNSNADFTRLIEEYIKEAKMISCEIEVSFTYEDNEIKVDYSNSDFINAITGNIGKSYKKLWEEMIQNE